MQKISLGFLWKSLFGVIVNTVAATAGALLIVALGLNLLGVTKIKLINYLPAVLMPILLCLIIPM